MASRSLRPFEWLDEIRACADVTAKGEEMKIKAIVNARKAGCSWEQIAAELGVTHQAASTRYGKYVNGKRKIGEPKASWK